MRRSSSLCVSLFLAVVAAPAALPAQTPTFSSKQISAGAPSGGTTGLALSGNFNGNGNTDLIVGVSVPNAAGGFKFLTGDGTGNFSVTGSLNFNPLLGPPQLVADVNGDGKDDIIILTPGCEESPCSNYPNEGDRDGIITVLLSKGNGTFAPGYVGTLPAGDDGVEGVVGDFNKDGKPDIAVLAFSAGNSFYYSVPFLCIFINQGNGTFIQTDYPTPDTFGGHTPPTDLVVGDFEGNGNQDVAFAFEQTEGSQIPFPVVLTFAGDGKGDFGPGVVSYTFDSYLSNYGQADLYAADLNDDGRTDLVINIAGKVAARPTRVPSLLANVNGKFYWSSAVYFTGFPVVALSDVNGDGKPDLVFVDNGSGTVAAGVYLGLGNGAFKTPHIPLTASGSEYTPSIDAVPLKKGALPSLIVSNYLQTLQLFVNTTK